MLRTVLAHVRAQWMGALALFLVIAGGTAYAANTIGSADIIDGQVKTPDLAANAVNTAKIADGQVTQADIGQGAVGTAELKNDAVNSGKVANGTLAGGDVADNSLKGSDIDESTLSSIGGGGAAGGDLTGSYPNPQVRADAVGGGKVADDSLTGADIVESSLGTVPDADTLDGRDSRDFARLGGVVQSDGTPFQGSGYTVSHPDVGVYEVSFPSGTLSNCPPIATAMVFTGLIETSGRLCSGGGAGSVTFTTVDTDGVAHNSPFVFMGM